MRRRDRVDRRRFLCVNVCLLCTAVLWLCTYTQLLSTNHNSEFPVKDHPFDTDADYTLETFDFMELHHQGKAKRTNIVEGPIPMESKSCWFTNPGYPAAEDIRRSGPDWQIHMDTDKLIEIYIYNAYYDPRHGDMFPEAHAVIQVLVMVRRELRAPIYCQLWKGDHSLLGIVKAHWTEIWQRPWDPRNRFYVAGLLSCPVQSRVLDRGRPKFISLTSVPCAAATNVLQIIGFDHPDTTLPPTTHNTVVCVKGMDFLNDVSHRLIEWLEAQLLFGADKVLLYTYAVHPSIAKVLRHYEKAGKVQHIRLTLPGNQPNVPSIRSRFIWRNRQQKRRNELVPYNDCLLRHVQTHRYALIVDIDEVVVPLQQQDWPQMLQTLAQLHPLQTLAAYSIINAFKFDNLTRTAEMNTSIPEYMWMLRHNRRSAQLSAPGVYSKCFMHIPNVLTVFNHYPLHRLRRNVAKSTNVPASVALKLHYKSQCPVESAAECDMLTANTLVDHSLDRFANELMNRVGRVIQRLKLA